MAVHVQILRAVQHVERGETVMLHAGDSVSVGRAVALRWEVEGIARPWRSLALTAEEVAGVRFFAAEDATADRLRGMLPIGTLIVVAELEQIARIELSEGERAVWWSSFVPLGIAELVSGLEVVRTWDAAVPLDDYRVLAADIGTEEDRERTQALIHDLRCPVYAPALWFLRREGLPLVQAYLDECAPGDEPRLAFLRAYWQEQGVKLLALPAHWSGAKV